MKKILLDSLLIGLIFVVFSGCAYEDDISPVVNDTPETNTEEVTATTPTEELIGGERDEHGCLGPAGYSWCEQKQKCLRAWEETCNPAEPINTTSELMTRLKAYNREKSDTTLVSAVGQFKWKTENGEIVVDGETLHSEKISKDALNMLSDFFLNYGFEKNDLNITAGTVYGAEGYTKDNFVCIVKSGLTGYRESDDDWIPPEPDKYDVKIKCGSI